MGTIGTWLVILAALILITSLGCGTYRLAKFMCVNCNSDGDTAGPIPLLLIYILVVLGIIAGASRILEEINL